MVEIEWDGIELAAEARRTVLQRLRALAGVVDPDGRARLRVEIRRSEPGTEAGPYCVVVAGQDRSARPLGAECRAHDLFAALHVAFDEAVRRWRRARGRAA